MKNFPFILLLLFADFGYSQNLIPNGDFELGPDSTSVGWELWEELDSTCSGGAGPYDTTIKGPDFWVITVPSPDRVVEWDSCFIPNILAAQSGAAYVHFGGYEAGKTTLLSPLEKDSLYRLSYYVMVDLACPLGPPSRITFRFNGGDSVVSPMFYNSQNWEYYDTIFTASATSTEIEIIGSWLALSCAGVDNIKLEKTTSNSVKNYQKNQQVKVYPNPSHGIVQIEIGHNMLKDIKVFDAVGDFKKVVQKHAGSSIQLDFSSYQAGVYFIYIKTNQSNVIKKVLLIK
ncbi:MAG: hypothetical protein COA57_05730 [Flavobacteriales bacterium]|nr:MAG: hypothetical protein COA57_05730 [Flavobacteriales bacterium]